MTETEDELLRKIKILNEQVWEFRATVPLITRWLSNFDGLVFEADTERLYALFLLSNFMYFGAKETRELLKSLYRDAFKYPVIEMIRKTNADTLDSQVIDQRFDQELRRTRFLGVGNPAESGTHLLYYFRQENRLAKELFINSHELFSYESLRVTLRDDTISRYIFIDDIAGSGTQARQYSKTLVRTIKALSPSAHVAYHMLFATSEALHTIHSETAFDRVTAVFDLDQSFRCFGAKSRYFARDAGVDLSGVAKMCEAYGHRLWSDHPLGYKTGQLLLGFHHNTPDNTLPIFWFDSEKPPWHAMFRRYPKIEW
jgi:hypothetical protein